MFGIFHGDVLIGRSELECGDPPMGVAYGKFEPADAFTALRFTMEPSTDSAGKETRDMRHLAGLRARTAEGIELVCVYVGVSEYGEADDPLGWEVSCLGIEWPSYEELFPHHVKAYDDLFKK